MKDYRSGRRGFLIGSGVIAAASALRIAGSPHTAWAQAAATSPLDRPLLSQGISIGDVFADRAIVWSRSDRPGRLVVEWDTTDRFENVRRILGPHALEDTDFTAKLDLTQLPPDQRIFLRVMFQSDDLRGRRHSRGAEGRGRQNLEEHHDAREEQGRGDARRLSRQPPLQFTRRKRPRVQRHRAADLAPRRGRSSPPTCRSASS